MKAMVLFLMLLLLQGAAAGAEVSIKQLRQSAERGNAIAQFKLGYMYDQGQGVRQDAAEAMKWYRKAAEQDHAGAQALLGSKYSKGKDVHQDAV